MAAALSLFAATPQQIEVSRRRTGASAWGSGMTLDEYVQRDIDLQDSECGREGRYLTWVLAPRNDPHTLDFLCSCETFRRSGLTSRMNHTSPKPDSEPLIEQVECYGIASVFTPPQYRGKGYARLMMSLLHWALAGNKLTPTGNIKFPFDIWGSPPAPPKELGMGDATFSALWSDVGDFYGKCSPDGADDDSNRLRKSGGWVIRGTRMTRWCPRPDASTALMRADTGSDLHSYSGEWQWLTQEEVNRLLTHDAELMRKDLRARWFEIISSNSTSSSKTKVLFTFLPSGGVEAFQRERLRRFWEKEKIVHWGVALSDPLGDLSKVRAFATWTLDLRPPAPRTLVITRFRCGSFSEESERSENCHGTQVQILCELLQKVWEYCSEHDIQVVEIWNFPLELREVGYRCARHWFVGSDPEGAEFERTEHLPAFKWYGHEYDLTTISSTDSGLVLEEDEVEWVFNEKFCWC
ncbi:hypothetical protein GGU10DRAFT_321361 [Lentinula aff. detonsa]|uniref:LYC1 C-terminal domain-containing protein n=1 Tax=Lentinula aff. detonsa TaxID=2804958 RepID=A0AA38KDG1_9AGAR|nr:hypothetical protein GGU10DRAFT_321361 [Lentinula aff. detonsa]